MEDIIVSQAMLDAGALALLRAEASGTDGETMLREIYLAMVKAQAAGPEFADKVWQDMAF